MSATSDHFGSFGVSFHKGNELLMLFASFHGDKPLTESQFLDLSMVPLILIKPTFEA